MSTGGNLLDSWITVGAAATLFVAVIGGLLTFFRFMRTQEGKIDRIAADVKENQQIINAQLLAIRTEMSHRFERLDDQNSAFVKQREMYTWIDLLRELNPTHNIPSLFRGMQPDH